MTPLTIAFDYEGTELETPAAATTHIAYCEREGTDNVRCSRAGFEISTGGGSTVEICAQHFATALATGEFRIAQPDFIEEDPITAEEIDRLTRT